MVVGRTRLDLGTLLHVSDDGTCSFVSAPTMVDTMISSTSLPTSTEWWSRPGETGPRQKTMILRPTHLADSMMLYLVIHGSVYT